MTFFYSKMRHPCLPAILRAVRGGGQTGCAFLVHCFFIVSVFLAADCFGNTGDEEYPNFWLPVGECITYKIQWGIFPVAETRVTTEWIREEERTLLAIKARTRTYSFFDTFCPVNDFIESIVDPETFTPLRFSKNLSEGRYRLNEITTFDHENRIAHWKHLIKNDEKDFAIEPDTRDLLSFMFFMRSQKLEPNRSYHFSVMADEKLYDLYVNTKNYVQLNLSRFGRVRSLYIQPEAKFQGFFVRVGRLQVWISDDKRCICTKAIAKAAVIGTIRMILEKVEGPGDDFWIKHELPDQSHLSKTSNGGSTNAN